MGLKHMENNGFLRIKAARGGTMLSHSGHPTRGCNLVRDERERPDVLVEFEPVAEVRQLKDGFPKEK